MELSAVNDSHYGWYSVQFMVNQLLPVAQDLQQCQKAGGGFKESSEYSWSNGICYIMRQDGNKSKQEDTK